MDDLDEELTPERAAGLTVNKRLYAGRLLVEFDAAVAKTDIVALRILGEVYLGQPNIDGIIESGTKKK